jgi:hypothetical protein
MTDTEIAWFVQQPSSPVPILHINWNAEPFIRLEHATDGIILEVSRAGEVTQGPAFDLMEQTIDEMMRTFNADFPWVDDGVWTPTL